MSKDILEIDGSYLEGGGQILRNALSLSCILGKPIRIVNIRANRPNPGLSNQHLFGLNLLQKITGAKVHGNSMKSTEIDFVPGNIKSDNYVVDTRTAASVTLVLQAALPVLAFGNSSSKLELIGGTNVGMAPQVDYMTEVFRANLERFGVTFDFDLEKRGYYPRGGGRCKVTIPRVDSIKAADITKFGTLTDISGWCFVAGRLPGYLAEDMKRATVSELKKDIDIPLQIEAYKEGEDVAQDNGSGIILKAVTSEGCTVGADVLGGKHIEVETMGTDVAAMLKAYIKHQTCVDRYAQDQLILFMALGTGVSRIRTCALTNHTRTAIHIAELMTGVKFKIEDVADEHAIITCEGIGFCNTN